MQSQIVNRYLNQIKSSMEGLDKSIAELFKAVHQVKKRGGRILILGNGGSLAIAQHLAQDLLKLCRVRVWTVNCPSVITAYANDEGFERVYSPSVEALLDPDDPVLVFSCSGKSPNYEELFFSKRNPVLSVVGTDGGFLKTKSKVSVHIQSNDYQICETAFCVVADLLVKALMEKK